MKHSKIAIIGTGNVGSTIAYALMLKNIVAEIRLLDINKQRCIGEFLDLSDALAFNVTSKIKESTYKEVADSDIIIITAGKAQAPGQSRTNLLNINRNVIHSIFKELHPINPKAIIIMVTNPVDILTLQAQKLLKLPENQVFGSGTYLDTQRLRLMLATKFNVAINTVQTYILGEHGDTQFVAWSLTEVGGRQILDMQVNQKELDELSNMARLRADEIISCKGSTFYGIAACVASICQSIIFDQKNIIPVSYYQSEFNICLSMPCIIGESGIEKRFAISLTENEMANLQKSAKKLASFIQN